MTAMSLLPVAILPCYDSETNFSDRPLGVSRQGADLSGADLYRANLVGVRCAGAIWTGARLPAQGLPEST